MWLIFPCTYVPLGIRIRSSMTIGNDVMAYTASPSFAVLVEMACFKVSGTFVPAGITRPPALASFWLAELSACAVVADWAKQLEHRKRQNTIQRITSSPNGSAVKPITLVGVILGE